MNRLRIVLGDDHALVLNGIMPLLAPHHEVIGAGSNGR